VLDRLPNSDRRTRRIAWEGSNASGGYTINFEVITLDAETRTALCTIRGVECGVDPTSLPGQDITPLEVEICDPYGCYFNEPASTIIGRHGVAKWMLPLEATVCQPTPDYSGDFACQWEVQSICCPIAFCQES
jgi:hypothetical protein